MHNKEMAGIYRASHGHRHKANGGNGITTPQTTDLLNHDSAKWRLQQSTSDRAAVLHMPCYYCFLLSLTTHSQLASTKLTLLSEQVATKS